MAAPCFIAWNGTTGTTPFTAPPTSVATGTTTKTMLQIKPGSSKIRIIEWGYAFDTVPTAAVKVELIETGTVFATVTTLNSADIVKYNDVSGGSSLAVVGTSASGFTASAEGTITAARTLAYQQEWGQQFKQQFPLGREPEVNAGSALRIRATTSTSINMTCYIIWEE